VQKVCQYFNLPILRSLLKPKLALSDERKIYSSSRVSINIHEEYQKKYGDLNERTFKILCAGGLQVIDEVPTLRKYFTDGKEIVIAKNKDDWFEKIQYYIDHPEKSKKIGTAGREKVLKHHTYHNRVKQIIKLYQSI
jgi:spore maturation protein CgeB